VLDWSQPPSAESIAAPTIDYIGPFEHHKVVVDGWEVPFVTANPMEGGMVELVLDDRFALDLALADAERIVPFIANAISVALGFSAHPDGDEAVRRDLGARPRRLRRLDSGEAEEPLE
jgi:hypothetical protein